ncbi:MAG TPA: CheR family methyltransferase [Anaerolineae bacterium]|nr:CheR family methyltransferase [Anaerolineae bacterium]
MAFTYFFRDQAVLDLIAQHALPDLTTRRYINVWDAGCAYGPEPYSLAITFREHMGHFLFRNVRIYATDIDESQHFGDVIARGVYTDTEVGRVPADILTRYFEPSGEPGHMRVRDEIRGAVRYQRHDLLTLQPIRTEVGLIVCKNVLLHFTPEQRVAVLRMFHDALMPDGYLVTEQTQKLPPEIEPLFRRVSGAGQIFQKNNNDPALTQPISCAL